MDVSLYFFLHTIVNICIHTIYTDWLGTTEYLNGLDKMKKWVEDRGLERATVTNYPRENAEFMIRKLGLFSFFDVVIIEDECELEKLFLDPYF